VRGFGGHLRDPHRVNLRKAARACIVVPGVFAVFVVGGNSAAALFAAFGSFAALVFSDFGGPIPRRFRAYVLLALVGGALLALGTAVPDDAVVVAFAVTLVVVFVIMFSGALGGYFTASGTSVTLAFVLAVMTPGVEADFASRELGWIVGVLVAGVAACVLWPVHQRDRVRAGAARVLHEAARALALPAAERDLTALRDADTALADRAGVVYRPAGSITREHALVAFVIATRRLLHLLELVTAAELSPSADPTPEYTALSVQIGETLARSADAVADEQSDGLDIVALEQARDAHTAALETWAASAVAADGATRVIDAVSATFPLRRLSLAAVQVAQDADASAHDVVRSRADGEATVTTAWQVLRAHSDPRSVRFRNAARAALGLALAVVVAKETSVEHAFWVVLAALSVLRSNALGTGATALQALLGACIGFGVASLVMTTMGGDDTWLWIALPIVTFLAAYTPGAVNFVVGQAGFTVFVVVLFNIFVPEGWRTGLVRVQDIAIGAGISVAVGALLWPRGARGVARRSFAELLQAGTAHLSLALGVALQGSPGDLALATTEVTDARARAVAALEDLALEHGGGHVDREGWGALLVEALLLELAAAGVVRGHARAEGTGCRDAVEVLVGEGRSAVASIEAETDRLVRDGIHALAPAARSDHRVVPPELAACLESKPPPELSGALDLVWVHEWLMLVAEHAV
jgi:uncharacterized membrane protein YccC